MTQILFSCKNKLFSQKTGRFPPRNARSSHTRQNPNSAERKAYNNITVNQPVTQTQRALYNLTSPTARCPKCNHLTFSTPYYDTPALRLSPKGIVSLQPVHDSVFSSCAHGRGGLPLANRRIHCHAPAFASEESSKTSPRTNAQSHLRLHHN